MASRGHGLLLQIEAEVACAVLDLVLSLQVVHAVCGDSIDGQNQVSNGNPSFGRLPTISQLHKETTTTHRDSISSNMSEPVFMTGFMALFLGQA